MPRLGSYPYTYSLPTGYAAVSGTPISSTVYNSTLVDMQTAFNDVLPLNFGGTGATTAIGAWDMLSAQGSNIASATSIGLDAATGPFVNITGTTTITSISLADGKSRSARAAGAFQLTASSSLVVNGSTSTNYTTVLNDYLLIQAQGSVTYVWVVNSGRYLPLTGGTLTGNLNIAKTYPGFVLDATGGPTYRLIYGQTDGLNRWGIILGDSTAESGANAGSNFSLNSYDDSGVAIESVLVITRATGAVAINGNTAVTGTLTATGAISENGNHVYSAANPPPCQPIPTSSTLGVGTTILAFLMSGTTVNNGATIAGSSLQQVNLRDTGSYALANGFALTGTWMNVSGASIGSNHAACLFVRTA